MARLESINTHKDPVTGKPINQSAVSIPVVPVLAIFYLLLAALIHYQHHVLPTPLPADAPVQLFSEGRAFKHLATLANSSGVYDGRITGSYANEIVAPKYILQQLLELRTDAARRGYRIDIDLQRDSGAYNLDFLSGFTNIYQDVTNVVARVYYVGDGNAIHREEHAVMLSAHYDSALYTQAASDDLISIANILEIGRVVTHLEPTRHALLLHFTGSEETVLQSSHLWATKHKWRDTVDTFINIESAGGSARELLFQAGPGHSYLIALYGSLAPRPYGNSVGQDIFASGLIPADTDFRQYRDYADLSGMDIAYVGNGWIYHTTLDTADRIEPGSLQRTGENLLPLVTHLCNATYLPIVRNARFHTEKCYHPTLAKTIKELLSVIGVGNSQLDAMHEEGALENTSFDICDLDMHSSPVYFDVLGMYMIVYSTRIAQLLNVAVLGVSVIYLLVQLRRHSIMQLLSSVMLLWLTLMMSIVTGATAGALQYFVSPMVWYNHVWTGFGLFVAPALAITVALQRYGLPTIYKNKAYDPAALAHAAFVALILHNTIILSILTVIQLNSAYLFAVATVSLLWGRSVTSFLFGSTSKSIVALVSALILSCLFPAILQSQLAINATLFLTPLLGRAGDAAPSDIVIGVIWTALCFVVTQYTVSFIQLWSRSAVRTVHIACLTIYLLTLLTSTQLDSYSVERAKRLFSEHMHRYWFDKQGNVIKQDSNLWISGMDYQGTSTIRSMPIPTSTFNTSIIPGSVDDHQYALKDAVSASIEEGNIYNDVAWYLPVKDMIKDNMLVPTHTQSQRKPSLRLLKTESRGHNRRRLYFSSTGPHHQTLYIKRRETGTTQSANSTCCSHVVEWSFYRPESEKTRESLYRSLGVGKSELVRKRLDDVSKLGPLYSLQQLRQADADHYFVFYASGLPPPIRASKAEKAKVTTGQPDYDAADPIAHLFPEWSDEREWNFWIEVRDTEIVSQKKPYNPKDNTLSELHLAIALHHFDEDDPVVQRFHSHLEPWITAAGWGVTWESHVY